MRYLEGTALCGSDQLPVPIHLRDFVNIRANAREKTKGFSHRL